jgi:hypothetical protein
VSRRANVPRHGFNHLPGGSDPLPCCSGFTHPGSISTAIFAPGSLVAWWRLGESTAWPAAGAANVTNWAADSSGNALHLDAIALQGAFAGLALPTPNVTGGLEPGDAEDGALQFNEYYRNNVGSQPHQWLFRDDVVGFHEDDNDDPGWTVACWVKYLGAGSNFDAPVISTFNRVFGGTNYGWTIALNASTGKLVYIAGVTEIWRAPFGLAPNVWTHFAMALEKNGATYDRRFYLNGNLIEELTGLTDLAFGGGPGPGLWIGGGNTGDAFTTLTAVGVDETAIWTVPLTSAQVVDIYNARMLNDGDSWTSSTISGADVADNTIPGTKIVEGSITSRELQDGAFTETEQTLADVTTWDVSSTQHGYAPKAPSDATRFLNGAADPDYAQVKDSDLATTDVTSNDATAAKHGFLPKLSGDAGDMLDGTGAWVTAQGDPFTDTWVWMPLADTDGTLVLDADDNLIPTLIPL